MPKVPAVLALCVLVAACKAPREEPAPSTAEAGPSGPPQTFAFGWKLPCRVPVVERSEQDGAVGKLRFTLSLRPAEKDRIDVGIEDLQYVEFMGQPITPELRAQVEGQLAVSSALPGFAVTPQGAFIEATGFDALYAALAKGGKVAPDVLKRMQAPDSRAALTSAVSNDWQTWVGAWAGLRLAPGDARDGTTTAAIGDVTTIPAKAHVEYVNDVPGGRAHLLSATLVEGDAALDAMRAYVVKTGSRGPDAGTMTRFLRMVRLEAETDPATLRPARTRSEVKSELDVDGATNPHHEVREDTFDWSHAQGCQ
jgi:hypothetical protein